MVPWLETRVSDPHVRAPLSAGPSQLEGPGEGLGAAAAQQHSRAERVLAETKPAIIGKFTSITFNIDLCGKYVAKDAVSNPQHTGCAQ